MVILFLFLCLFCLPSAAEHSAFNFRPKAPISRLRKWQTSVQPGTCDIKPKDRLRMPHGTISQLPQFNRLPTTLIHPNRSALLHLHNAALSRAFFFSYVLQQFNTSQTDFKHLPGLLYNYLSVAADVTANPKTINASTLMYDTASFYPNWLLTKAFNTTLPLFALRARRIDDFDDPNNWLREPILRTIEIVDLGASQDNYTHEGFKSAPWYGNSPGDPGFLPDSLLREVVGGKKHLFQFKFHSNPKQVNISHVNL